MDTLLYLAIIPVVLLLSFIYKKDTKSEPMNMVVKIFFLGVFSCIPTIIVELFLGNMFSTDEFSSLVRLFINVFIGVALVEEFFKWIIVKLVAYNNSNHDETYDAIVYSVFASLGFACFENIGYVFSYGFGTALIRAFSAVPGHACFGVIMGYFFSKAKQSTHNGSNNEGMYLLLSLVVPTLVHTIYDFLVFSKVELLTLVWFVFVIALFIVCFILVSKAAKENAYFIKHYVTVTTNQTNTVSTNTTTTSNFCPYCGKQNPGGNFCQGCGAKLN